METQKVMEALALIDLKKKIGFLSRLPHVLYSGQTFSEYLFIKQPAFLHVILLTALAFAS